MKKIIKDNMFLFLGASLPWIMIAIFAILSTIPKLLTPRPKYDFLYTVNSYTSNNTCNDKVDIFTSNKRVKLQYLCKDKSRKCYTANNKYTELYHYDAKKNISKKIDFDIPRTNVSCVDQEIVIDELKDKMLNTSNVAPDGYQYRNNYERTHAGLMGALFYGSNVRGPTLVKDSRVELIPYNHDGYTYYSGIKFLGWIVN